MKFGRLPSGTGLGGSSVTGDGSAYLACLTKRLEGDLTHAAGETFLQGLEGVLVFDALMKELKQRVGDLGIRNGGMRPGDVQARLTMAPSYEDGLQIVSCYLQVVGRDVADEALQNAVVEAILVKMPRYATTLEEAATALGVQLPNAPKQSSP